MSTTVDRPRSEIPEQYTWKLDDVYASSEAWRTAKDEVAAGLPHLRQHAGTLAASAATLADALELLYGLEKELSRLFVYASMLADQDTRDAAHEGMRQQMVQLAASLAAEAAYIEPEILRFPDGTVARFLEAEARLAPYRFLLQDIARRAAHTLSPAEEKLLADAAPVAGASATVYTILSNADFPYPAVRLHDGREVTLTPAAFAAHRASRHRDDRALAMQQYFGSLGRFARTFGSTMSANLQRAIFYARARKYGSTLEAALDGPNIPVSVYTRLVDGVNRHLPSFHRYLALRRRMLGVDELHYYDLYAPLVESVDLAYSPEASQRHIVDAMAPLGREYTDVLRRAFAERWIDFFPSAGKRSGAYSQGGAYDVHPYMLLNYNGKYDDMSTLAHELGHTMHSYFSNRTQPYATAGYHTFVAEVASTFNESLLNDHMLGTIADPAQRLALLGSYLEGIKGTVFRQTQFAEFELAMHRLAEAGEPVTGEALAALYYEITCRYYGHAQGVAVVDDYIRHEWSYIPHFYRSFYVFQYATSFTASQALAQKVKAGDADATRRMIEFLSSGGSDYPIALLARAGVDMTTGEPLELTIAAMNRVMDEMERLL
ncbi:MAG: oligoendopeptidase F [Acidobacteria bacterium]|nr:oligoendopeptidase F [Acidobacteriota bacterium]